MTDLKQQHLISIVIPCYNDSEYIAQSVSSALLQTYKNIEVIVVDDGSNLATKKVLKNLEGTIYKLITQGNRGQSAARNVGIQNANGEFILVLDSDDYFENDFCEKALPYFLNSDAVKIVTCEANLHFDNQPLYVFMPPGGDIKNFLTGNGALGTSMFRKRDWEMCDGYDETMRDGLEDWEFFIRLLKNGGVAKVINEPLYNYRKRTNTTTARANKIKYNLMQYIYFKHRDLYIENFETFVGQLLEKIEREESEKIKNTERLDFRLGKNILAPLRWIKNKIR